MTVSRRSLLLGTALGAAGVSTLAACAPNSGGGTKTQEASGSSGGGAASATLAFTWWGNEVRNKNTTDCIDVYTKANPSVTITPQPGEWGSYWDKLATQVAGGTAPDVIQMDLRYISEYGNRGALLDLSSVDTSKFLPGTVDAGKLDGKLYGINAGINTVTIMANPAVFEKAGVEMPDDTTWTWDSLITTSADVAKKGNLTFGCASVFTSDTMFEAWLRQQGKSAFTADGKLGFEAADAQGWFDLTLKALKAGAMGTAAQVSEEATKPQDQSAIAVGTGAMQSYWSNQVEALSKSAGTDLKILRFPSIAGKATDRKAWYKASMLWSASAKTQNPEAVVALIDWWVNSTECANIQLAERGLPPNGDIQNEIKPKLSEVQQSVAKFLTDIEPELGDSPVPPPPGGNTIGDVFLRFSTEVIFERESPADAAKAMVDEVNSNLQG